MVEGQFRGNRMIAFGLLIKQAREKVGLTQEEVANRCGLVHSTYNKYERGGATYPPEPSVLSKLGTALNLTEDEMLVVMGYKPQPGTVSEAVRRRIIRDTSVSEYLAESWGTHSEDAVAAVEAIIRTARGTKEKK